MEPGLSNRWGAKWLWTRSTRHLIGLRSRASLRALYIGSRVLILSRAIRVLFWSILTENGIQKHWGKKQPRTQFNGGARLWRTRLVPPLRWLLKDASSKTHQTTLRWMISYHISYLTFSLFDLDHVYFVSRKCVVNIMFAHQNVFIILVSNRKCYNTVRPRKKRKPINEVIFLKTVMIYQKKFTLLQNSVYPLSFDNGYKMYWPWMAKHKPFQMVMSKLICAE